MSILKKGDLLLAAAIALIALAVSWSFKVFGNGDTARIAVIKQKGRVIRRIDLDRVTGSETFELKGDYPQLIQVEKGRIRVAEAGCPDQVCVETGWLTKRGDAAVCVPNGTIIEIEGEKSEVDDATY